MTDRLTDPDLDGAQDASEAWTMADLTPAGVDAVRARLRAGRMTDVTLDALEAHLIKRGSVGGAWQMCLITEVRRRQAAEKRALAVARELRNADTHDIVGRFLAALDGEDHG